VLAVTLCKDLAAVLLHDPLHGRQPHTNALEVFLGVQPLEDPEQPLSCP